MASQPQILANRLNAQKSTGPKTPEGKAAVAQNALKHGLSARRDVVITESQAEFDLHRDSLLAELAPQGPMESILADRIVTLSWRLKRAEAIQNQTIDAMHEKSQSNPLAKLAKSLRLKGLTTPDSEPTDSDPALTLGRIALKDFSNTRVLDRLLMYERRIEHSLFKTTRELQSLQLLRNLEPSTDPNPTPTPAAPPTTNPLNRTPAHPRIPIPRQPIVNNQSSIVNIESPPHRTTHPSQSPTPAPAPRETLHASHLTMRKTNPISDAPKSPQHPVPQRVNPISPSTPGKETNPIQIEPKPRSRCTSEPSPHAIHRQGPGEAIRLPQGCNAGILLQSHPSSII